MNDGKLTASRIASGGRSQLPTTCPLRGSERSEPRLGRSACAVLRISVMWWVRNVNGGLVRLSSEPPRPPPWSSTLCRGVAMPWISWPVCVPVSHEQLIAAASTCGLYSACHTSSAALTVRACARAVRAKCRSAWSGLPGAPCIQQMCLLFKRRGSVGYTLGVLSCQAMFTDRY